MFSEEGNAKIHKIVQNAIKNKVPWLKVQEQLYDLSRSNLDKYGEATDTAVRESVYITIYGEN